MVTQPGHSKGNPIIWRSSLAVIGLMIGVLVFLGATHGWSMDLFYWSLIIIPSIPMTLAYSVWAAKASSSYAAHLAREHAEEVAYFEPKLAHAERQLQALSTRVGGSCRRGELDWARFAGPTGLASKGAEEPTPSAWGRGSVLELATRDWHVEVTFGVEPLDPGPRPPWVWFVLLPRVTVKPAAGSTPRLNRFASDWAMDARTPVSSRKPLPRSIENAQGPLREASSKIRCFADRIEALGRPLASAPDSSSKYGHSAFEVESLHELVERAVHFTQALARA
jgi:hypothetical protein